MSKINTQAVKEQVVAMFGDLREIVTLYTSNDKEVAMIEANTILSREYKDGQISQIREKLKVSARSKFDNLQKNFELLAEVMRNNDNTYDFSDSEFASCVALLSATDAPLPTETIMGITSKFLGNRQALLALSEVAKEPNKNTIKKQIFNSETEITRLQERIIELDINFPNGILMLPAFKDDLLHIATASGIELTEAEKDLGTNYQEIVNLQMRAVMGLPN